MSDIYSAVVGDMSLEYQKSSQNQNVFFLSPKTKYGPYFYIGKKDYTPKIGNFGEEAQTFLGFTKPKSKSEADELYNIKKYENGCDWIHSIYIEVPANETQARVFIGAVENGRGVQLLLAGENIIPYIIKDDSPTMLE